MSFKILILGTSSATPTLKRHPSAQALFFHGKTFLIDCGEGTQIQCLRFGVKIFHIDKIFISHFHADHCLGLPGLLSTLSLMGRTAELDIFGPPGIREFVEHQLHFSQSHIAFNINYHELQKDKINLIYEDKHTEIRSLPLDHRIDCWGFLFKERHPYRKFDKEALKKMNVPKDAFQNLKYGKDYISPEGEVYSAKELTFGAPIHSYAYITDTLVMPALARQLTGTDLIYHEATFLHDKLENALAHYHSTAFQAAEFAREAKAGQLLLGHFSARYDDLTAHLEEAQSVFPNTMIAEEGRAYSIG